MIDNDARIRYKMNEIRLSSFNKISVPFYSFIIVRQWKISIIFEYENGMRATKRVEYPYIFHFIIHYLLWGGRQTRFCTTKCAATNVWTPNTKHLSERTLQIWHVTNVYIIAQPSPLMMEAIIDNASLSLFLFSIHSFCNNDKLSCIYMNICDYYFGNCIALVPFRCIFICACPCTEWVCVYVFNRMRVRDCMSFVHNTYIVIIRIVA